MHNRCPCIQLLYAAHSLHSRCVHLVTPCSTAWYVKTIAAADTKACVLVHPAAKLFELTPDIACLRNCTCASNNKVAIARSLEMSDVLNASCKLDVPSVCNCPRVAFAVDGHNLV